MTESIVMLETRKFAEGRGVMQGTKGEYIPEIRENTARGLFADGYARKATDSEVHNAKMAFAIYGGTDLLDQYYKAGAV